MRFHGTVSIPEAVVAHADTIKLENYKTNTPAKFQVRSIVGGDDLMANLSVLIGIPRGRLDFVYFSVAKGAEPHTDKLNPNKFEDTTFVVPVILPKGNSVIKADGVEVVAEVGGIYEFDHTTTHSMTLEDTESGCVVVMVAVKKNPAEWDVYTKPPHHVDPTDVKDLFRHLSSPGGAELQE